MKFIHTPRGFLVSHFDDLNGESCSLQQSSLANEEAIWLGCDTGLHVDDNCLARMHLNREQAGEIATVLAHFAKTGEILDQ